jgi:hypothetical protein
MTATRFVRIAGLTCMAVNALVAAATPSQAQMAHPARPVQIEARAPALPPVARQPLRGVAPGTRVGRPATRLRIEPLRPTRSVPLPSFTPHWPCPCREE